MGHKLARGRCKPQAGQRFTVRGKVFELRGKIGDGAVGIVRKANPLNEKTLMAVKFLAPDPKYIELAAFDDVAARFKREGERGAFLDHDHLINIFAYCDNTDGSCFRTGYPCNPFLLMEYIDGRTLESFIRRTPEEERGIFLLDQSRLNIAIQICHALEYLKDLRLIHRDVKPANVFLKSINRPARWHAKLGDFGVVKWGDFHAAVTTGTLTVTSQKGLGTLKYMSPEQAVRPKSVSVKSDIWSLGITLFELFTGQVLASAHHVYELQNARHSRGTTMSRFLNIGYKLDFGNLDLADLVLDMFLAPDGRPPIDKIRGRLETAYERRFNREWRADF
jgi:serine/threonine-protein kinase